MKLFLTIGYILFFQFIGVSQTYHVLYGEKMAISRTQYKGMPLDMFRQVKEASDNRVRVYELVNSEAKSKYMVLYSTYQGEKEDTDEWIASSKNIVLFKDFTKGYYVQHIDDRSAVVRELFDDIFDWKVDATQDTVIAGFKCQKATTLSDDGITVAWFTNLIPIMDGPYKYAGLPGLILRIENSFGTTEVLSIELLSTKAESILIPEKEKYISRKEFLDGRSVRVKRIEKKE